VLVEILVKACMDVVQLPLLDRPEVRSEEKLELASVECHDMAHIPYVLQGGGKFGVRLHLQLVQVTGWKSKLVSLACPYLEQ
jgi:hypothetical protein